MNAQLEFKFDFPATGGLYSSPQGPVCPPVQACSGSFLETKKCPRCLKVISIKLFGKNRCTKDGLSSYCLKCKAWVANEWRINNREKHILNSKKSFERTRDKKNERRRKAYALNREKYLERNKNWYNENQERVIARQSAWKKKNRKIVNERYKDRWKNNNKERIVQCLRTRIRKAVRGNAKSAKTITLLGCSIEYLWKHLESMFSSGMTRENYGKWHIDHIRPCSSFDLSDPEQQRQCFHYSNLQPLWAKDNLKKARKIIS